MRAHIWCAITMVGSVAQAQSLPKNLNSIKALQSSARARELVKAANREQRDLDLNGVLKLSDEAAAILAEYQGRSLCLNSLPELSPEAAKALASREVAPELSAVLSLDGLEEISDEVATALSRYGGSWLSLDGLKKLSVEAAAALSQHRGSLELNGLTELDSEVANKLAQHQGKRAADRKNPPSNWHEAGAVHGTLYLNGLTHLSGEAAEALARHEGVIYLDGVTTLSVRAAKALANCKGFVTLGGLQRLSAGAATALDLSPKILSLPPQFAQGRVAFWQGQEAARQEEAMARLRAENDLWVGVCPECGSPYDGGGGITGGKTPQGARDFRKGRNPNGGSNGSCAKCKRDWVWTPIPW